MRLTPGLTLAATLAFASVAGAQVEASRFSVTPRVGYVLFDDATSIENAPALSLSTAYAFNSMFSAGLDFSISRPNTRGEDFIVALTFGSISATQGDTTFFFEATQPVSVVNAALSGTARLPLAQFSPYVTAGVGYYQIYMDPQVMRNTDTRFGGMSGVIGAGINYAITPQTGIQLDVRDVIFTNYDRLKLNPSDERFTNVRFGPDFPAPPENKDVVHNFLVSLGFTFVPNFGGRDDEEDDQ